MSLILVGCTEPALQLDPTAKGGCEAFVCGGGNSPVIDNLGLHELNLSYPNYVPEPENHFRIKAFRQAGRTYIPHVVGGALTGQTLGAWPDLLAANVATAELLVENDSHVLYVLRIKETGTVDYWARPTSAANPNGVTKTTRYYVLEWKRDDPLDLSWENVCSGPAPEYGPDTLMLNSLAVVLPEGDRIDAKTKAVVGKDTAWFNIGCAGHLISKLHLTGHTEAAQVATANQPERFQTSLDDRTTMVKLLSADYCNTGRAFTVAGQPLGWIDDRGWMKYWQEATTSYAIEVRWGPTGARCMTKPRLFANQSDEGDAAFPDIFADIRSACGGTLPPPCTGDIHDLARAHLVSANPDL